MGKFTLSEIDDTTQAYTLWMTSRLRQQGICFYAQHQMMPSVRNRMQTIETVRRCVAKLRYPTTSCPGLLAEGGACCLATEGFY